MSKPRLFITLLLATLLVMIPLGTVGAAASLGDEGTTTETVSGVVQTIVVETDEVTEVSTVLVTLTMQNGKSTTVRLSAEVATTLGLVVTETQEEQVVTVNDLKIGESVQLDPLTVILDEGQSPLPEEPIIGTVQQIDVEVDELTEETTVLVTLLGEDGITLTVYRISLETAAGPDLELVTVEMVPVDVIVPNEAMIGQEIEINQTDVLEQIEAPNPVGDALGTFFGNLFGIDPALVTQYHDEGMGYGTIAQAGILAYAMDGDGAMMQAIMDAKLSGDYSTIVLPDGSTPTNWGQLRKAVMDQENAVKNLGAIISGHADDVTDEPETVEELTTTDDTKMNNGQADQHRPADHGKPDDKTNNGKGHDK